MKKSIALLTTLIFITFLITIAFFILNIKSSSTITLPQDNLIIKSLQKSLPKIEANSSKKLTQYINTYPINYKDFKALITIELLSDKINLNQYKNPVVKKILDKLLYKYQIKDSILFKTLLEENLTKDEFDEILKRYYKITKDKNIFLIPWERYFYFLNGRYKVICEFNQFDIDCNKTLFAKYKNAKHILIKAKVNYILQNQESNLSLIYDLKEKKVIKIEKYPLY